MMPRTRSLRTRLQLACGGAGAASPGRVLKARSLFAAALAAAVIACVPGALAQTGNPAEPGKARDSAGHLSHDLSGVWMPYPDTNVPPGTGKNAIDQSKRPPLTAWGQARLDATRPLLGPRAIPGQENSPSLNCTPDGPPKLLQHPNPFEIIQTPSRVFMFFEEQHIWRTVWADGRPVPKDPDPTYLGYAVSHWEGDTFVVDTVGFNDKQWADPFGNPRSEEMHLTERYRRRDPDTLEQQIIMDDPKSYNGVWVSPPKLYKLEPGWEIAEWFCIPDEDKSYDETVRKPAGAGPSSGK